MPDKRRPIITLTTDFGTTDHYVASVKGAILEVAPEAAIVDVTHEIAPHDIPAAGWTLRNAFVAFPPRSIHIAVVDPGVGTRRRAILAVTKNHFFIGPDNGIFSFVFAVEPPSRVVSLTSRHYLRSEVSSTFHARDVFAPVAAHLAHGIEPQHFGETIDDPVLLDLARPRVAEDGAIRATVIHIDRFGNAILNVTRAAIEGVLAKVGAKGVSARVREAKVEVTVPTYGQAPPGIPILLYNSSGYLEIAANTARAADRLGLETGDEVALVPIRT